MSAFAVGITSFGGPERIFYKFNWNIGDREQTNFDSDDEDIVAAKVSEEEEAYQKIKDEFGIEPVRMLYLPKDIEFEELTSLEEIQNIYLTYSDGEKASISYHINANYNTSSIGTDMEDNVVKEYEIEVGNVCVHITQYQMPDSRYRKIRGTFEYNEIQYFITGNGLKEEEFNKIIKKFKLFLKNSVSFFRLMCIYSIDIKRREKMKKKILMIISALVFGITGMFANGIELSAQETSNGRKDYSYLLTGNAIIGQMEQNSKGAYLSSGTSVIKDAGTRENSSGGNYTSCTEM